MVFDYTRALPLAAKSVLPLNDRAVRLRSATHEKRYPDKPFVTDDGYFTRRAILHDVQQQRDDRIDRKINERLLGARLVNKIAKFQFNRGQILRKAFSFDVRDRREQMITFRIGSCSRQAASS
jgi:hypothetical protein